MITVLAGTVAFMSLKALPAGTPRGVWALAAALVCVCAVLGAVA